MRVSQLTQEINYQKWSEIIEECRNSGIQVSKWCKEKDVSLRQYYYWQNKICKKVSENLPALKEKNNSIDIPTFTEIKMPSISEIREIALTVSINDATVQIHNYADENTVAAALRIIKSL